MIVPLVGTLAVAALLSVKLEPTAVLALLQLAEGVQPTPGVAGELPPLGSTEA